MSKAIVFDMDGTIADLYNVPNWLDDLLSEKTDPYRNAKPIYNSKELNNILYQLKQNGFKIFVTSWGSKGGTTEYTRAVKQAKKEWLKMQDFPYDELHVVKYGTPKHYVTRGKAKMQILVDDNDNVREAWTLGSTINAQRNIINELIKLIN